jgi:hypothetical protein
MGKDITAKRYQKFIKCYELRRVKLLFVNVIVNFYTGILNEVGEINKKSV